MPLVYVNQVGGQDELIFDGASMVFDATGELVRGRPSSRRTTVVDVEVEPVFRAPLDPGAGPDQPLPEVSS